jgi:hypothetical protein
MRHTLHTTNAAESRQSAKRAHRRRASDIGINDLIFPPLYIAKRR